MPRLLIIEDDAETCRLLASNVRRLGHTTDVCGDADQALRTLARSVYHGLIVDVGLPGKDGYDLLRAVRARGLSDAPVIVATVTDPEDLPPDVRVEAWLPKPFARQDLACAVQAMFAAT